MSARSRTTFAHSVGGISLFLCLVIVGFWIAGLRMFRANPLWLEVGESHGGAQYGVGSLDGQMELRRVQRDEKTVPGPHCGERAACAAFERQFPAPLRYEYLGCAVGREPIIDVVGKDEQLVKTGTAWFLILPHGVAALLLGILPAVLALQHIRRGQTSHPSQPLQDRATA